MHRPFRNRIESMHPIAAMRDAAFAEAMTHAPYNDTAEDYLIADERKFLIYGRLWMILLAVWDEINNQTDPGGPDFEELMWLALNATAYEVMEAMYG